ncbi:MAG TPA: AI-2E family transporter [Gammaproteobacteria bacterium]|jgi:predicted PurR-regulated permease PerM|nr:AI-2E family transporter [Gammaproteobacteria bacterium]
MKPVNQAIFIFIAAIGIILLYLLAPILTPFLLGALIAYLADPLVKRLEKWHLSHLLSVIIVFFSLTLILLLLILMLTPLVQIQISLFVEALPQMLAWIEDELVPFVKQFVSMDTLKTSIPASLSKTGWVVNTVLQSGVTVIEVFVNLILTPVVAFYLLRDWDKVLHMIKSILPPAIKPTTLQLARDCNEVLGAFFRGQLLVMLALCVIYGVGLTVIGLKVGLIVGIIGGILSIVPYLGSIFVVITASILALIQFGTWQSLIGVGAVFLIGQLLENYLLIPYLIGERIGLHPVAVIFAIMAGGVLFGFFGILLALPVAAVVMVLLRFFGKRCFG